MSPDRSSEGPGRDYWDRLADEEWRGVSPEELEKIGYDKVPEQGVWLRGRWHIVNVGPAGLSEAARKALEEARERIKQLEDVDGTLEPQNTQELD